MSTLELENHITLHCRPHLSFLRHVSIKTRSVSVNNSYHSDPAKENIPLNLSLKFRHTTTPSDIPVSLELIRRNQKMDSGHMFGLEGAVSVFGHLYLHAELLRSS